MKNDPVYREELAKLPGLSHAEFVGRAQRFIESYGDHDEECPVLESSLYGSDAELEQCACGYVFRWELLAELKRRLVRGAGRG